MNNLSIALDGAWKVLLAGLLLGAGVPVLFSLAVSGLAMAEGGEAAQGDAPKPIGRVIALIFFVIILLLVVFGLTWLIVTSLGYHVGFNGIVPQISK